MFMSLRSSCSVMNCCVTHLLIGTLDSFFFFKQKTAYEMRISDWSSDVCSSDLPIGQQASSMTQAAVAVAHDLFGRFDRLALLWIGLGEMGEIDRKSVV